jgi:hypothetical protein
MGSAFRLTHCSERLQPIPCGTPQLSATGEYNRVNYRVRTLFDGADYYNVNSALFDFPEISSTMTTSSRSTLQQIPAGVWVLGFVSMLMDISSEMIHSLLPLFMVTSLGASAFAVGLVRGWGNPRL